jgi:hypothetical protein
MDDKLLQGEPPMARISLRASGNRDREQKVMELNSKVPVRAKKKQKARKSRMKILAEEMRKAS